MTTAMISLLVVTVLILGFIARQITKDAPDKAELARLRSKEQDLQRLTDDLQEKSGEIERLLTENATLQSPFGGRAERSRLIS